MKIEGDDCQKFKVYLDGELFSLPNKIIWLVDMDEGEIEYIFTNEHFPYWPSKAYGEIKLEMINE